MEEKGKMQRAGKQWKKLMAAVLGMTLVIGGGAGSVYAEEYRWAESDETVVLEETESAEVPEVPEVQQPEANEAAAVQQPEADPNAAPDGTVFVEEAELTLNAQGDLFSTYFPTADPNAVTVDAYDKLKGRAKAALDSWQRDFNVSDLGMNISDKDVISMGLSEVLNSSYRYFYVKSYSYSYNTSTGQVVTIRFNYGDRYKNADDSLNRGAVDERLSVLDAALNKGLECIVPGMSDVEKVLAVHDYIATVCDYDQEGYLDFIEGKTPDEDTFNMYGVLIKNKAVCQGYAEAFCAFMQKLGLESYIVTSDPMNHAWNLVKLNGNWFHVDITWDDPVWTRGTTYYGLPNNDYADEGFVTHRYFLKSDDEFFELDHEGWLTIIPDATVSDAYTDYAFFGADARMSYYDGYWYNLVETYDENGEFSDVYLQKAKIDGSSSSKIELLNLADYAHGLGNSIYYSSFGANAICRYNLAAGEENVLVDINMAYPGFKITEFNIRNGNINAVLCNTTTREFKQITVSANRVAGVTRYATALECAELMRKGGTFTSAVIANADNFPDALAGCPLAAQKNAPILLAGSNAEGTKATVDYVKKNVAVGGTVYLLGGTGAVPESVEADLKSGGYVVERLAGTNRYGTNLAIVEAMEPAAGSDIVVVSGNNYADSLSVSGIAGAKNMPIFLTPGEMSEEVFAKIKEINPANIYIIGGTAAVTGSVETKLSGLGGKVVRVAGENRYSTSVKIAEAFGMQNAEAAVFAYGGNFPDGLTGGVLAAGLNAPVLLISNSNYKEANEFLKKGNIGITDMYVMGGTAAISDDTVSKLGK